MTINKYNPDNHHRRSIRLKGYDYSQEGLYFITLCVQNRLHLFGNVIDGKMILNAIGDIAKQEWLNTTTVRDNIELHEFVIMSNHIHGIIEIIKKKATEEENEGFKSPKQTIGSVVRGYKIATIKKIKEYLQLEEDKINNGCKVELQFDPTSISSRSTPSGNIIRSIKDLEYKIWQRNYYEHIIKREQAYENISNYIIANPERWNEDTFNK